MTLWIKPSQLWAARTGCIHTGHAELSYSSGSDRHSAARPASTPQHLAGSASTVRAGRAEITPTMGCACCSQGKQRVNPDPQLFAVDVGNNYNTHFTVKQQW